MAKPYKPLWAEPPPEERDPYADVTVSWTVEPEDDEPAPEAGAPEPGGRRLAPLLLTGAVVAAVGLVGLLAPGGSLTAETVPSAWGDIPMRCATVRIEAGPRAVEAFRCFATGGRELPPGRYTTPRSNWTSDLTRQAARYNAMVISPAGELRGVAAYGPG